MIFTFFNAPLFATFLLGMFWKRCTPWGAFWGLVIGTSTAVAHYLMTGHQLHYPSLMAGNFWRSIYAWLACFICTIAISFFTKPKPESELFGLVYGNVARTPRRPGQLVQAPCSSCWNDSGNHGRS